MQFRKNNCVNYNWMIQGYQRSIGNSYTISSQLTMSTGVTKITERSNLKEWSILDEDDYKKIDRDITRSMLSAARKCGGKKKRTTWSPALRMTTQAIRYWDVITKRQGQRDTPTSY
jgi:hypothetical protein